MNTDGSIEVIYNGPGQYINQFLKNNNRMTFKDISKTIAANHLRRLEAKLNLLKCLT
ncbi:hypothetical protein [Maribacter thermophilus]|uniref:hypothetical protein n=1 Tax=Maribacter thermophilus TaxID=1197874 RepID=UPI00373FCE96